MHKKLLILFSFSPLFLFAQQQVKEYVQQNANPVSTISPDSINYKDLEAIGTAIGDAKVVMLGEQDHGDAPTFLAKTRLIKYLHEKKGFNVLAFESDFFGLNEGWENLNKDEAAINSFLKENIFGVWTECNTCSNLFFNYIPNSYKTKNPIIISGFDSQMILGYSYKNLMWKFDSCLKTLKLPITQSADYSIKIFPLLDTLNLLNILPADTPLYSQRDFYLNKIKSQLGEKISNQNFWMLVVENLIQNNIQLQYRNIDYWKSINARDKQMALNLKWLSDVKYPNEKIIVWAHNFHISKYSGNFDTKFLKNQISMGTCFTNDSVQLNKTYIIGFTSAEGTSGRMGGKIYDIEKPKPNSFENWISKDYNYAFVDFKKYNSVVKNNAESFYMQGSLTGNMFHKNFDTEWTKVFDGIFYIKQMYPCK